MNSLHFAYYGAHSTQCRLLFVRCKLQESLVQATTAHKRLMWMKKKKKRSGATCICCCARDFRYVRCNRMLDARTVGPSRRFMAHIAQHAKRRISSGLCIRAYAYVNSVLSNDNTKYTILWKMNKCCIAVSNKCNRKCTRGNEIHGKSIENGWERLSTFWKRQLSIVYRFANRDVSDWIRNKTTSIYLFSSETWVQSIINNDE